MAIHNRTYRPRPQYWASFCWFPVACLYAALVVPLSLWSMGSPAGIPGLSTPWGHATEILFGFALALVAGYLSGKQTRVLLLSTLLAWALARGAYWGWPGSWAAQGAQGLFLVMLMGQLLPRLRAAKRWRNQMLMSLMLGLAGLSWLAAGHWFELSTQTPLAGTLLLALLMTYIAGRAIAPAAAGEHYKRGYDLPARVQPAVEGSLIICLAFAAVLALLEWSQLAGGLVMLAGLLLVVRTLRWQLWPLRYRMDLMGLILGYLWLAIGLLVTGYCLSRGLPWRSALHLFTIGALGSLSTGMMLRVLFQRCRKRLPPASTIWICLALIAIATLARAATGWATPQYHQAWLWLSAASWSIAFGFCALSLLRVIKNTPK